MGDRTNSRTKNIDITWLVMLAAVVVLAVWVGFGLVARTLRPFSDSPPIEPGTPMPPIEMAGWLNLPAGESFDPAGKIVVVDLWATWCPPCRAEMPRLAEVAKRYRPLGVEFVGLTSETERDLPVVREFIADTPGFDWPVGYGAMDFWNALEIPGVPTIIVFGRDGRARWSAAGAGQPGLEAALDEALAAKPRAAGR
jgi:thiol-disulfide isomerase/thioredoxin